MHSIAQSHSAFTIWQELVLELYLPLVYMGQIHNLRTRAGALIKMFLFVGVRASLQPMLHCSYTHSPRIEPVAASLKWMYALNSSVCPKHRRHRRTLFAQFEAALYAAIHESFSGSVMVCRMRACVVTGAFACP